MLEVTFVILLAACEVKKELIFLVSMATFSFYMVNQGLTLITNIKIMDRREHPAPSSSTFLF